MKEQLREMVIAAKALQLCADIFAVFGIFLFAFIYFKSFHQNPFAALQSPYFVVTVFIPFVPAAFLAFLASKKRRKVRAFLEESKKSS